MSVLGIVGGMFGLYHVVPVNEAHFRIMGKNNKKVFMARDVSKAYEEINLSSNTYESAYWTVPFITKVIRLPLTNIPISIPDVKLNDTNMAKFQCDVICFVNIDNPVIAGERTQLTATSEGYTGHESIEQDFRTIIESIMRTVATKQTILDMYMNRATLDEAVTKEVSTVFPKWGLRLVDLEIKDLKDIQGSTIISDIERKIAAQINADARVKVATETKRAEISEAENKKEAEMVKAKNEEEWRQRQIQKDQAISIAEQEKNKMTATKQQEANKTQVEANRTLLVGNAEIEQQATIKRAEGVKQKTSLEAEGEANKTQAIGNAEANIIRLKKVAEAEGTEKLALAQQKYNDAATNIEVIRANRDVALKMAEAQGKAYEHATINMVVGSTQELLNGGLLGNIKLGAKEGIALQQFVQATPNNPIVDKIKEFMASKTTKEEKK